MPSLQRSRSAVNVRAAAKKEEAQTPNPTTQSASEHRQSRAIERPKTAEARNSSFSRPRTAASAERRRAEMATETIEFKSGNDTWNFPTPSPRLPPRSASHQMPVAPSPLAADASPAIGVALGSPTQAPPKWGRSFTTNDVLDRHQIPAPHLTALPRVEEQGPALKKKKSGWKSIGNLFGKKPPKPAVQEPFYKVKVPQSQSNSATRSQDNPSPLHSDNRTARPSPHVRVPSVTRGLARVEARMEADLAQFHPEVTQKKRIRSPSMIQKAGFSPMFRPLGRDSEDMFSPSMHERNDSPLSVNESGVPRTPKLDLDLPHTEFERYSVMFEKLLDGPNKSSLLERRQSKSQRKMSLKMLEPIKSPGLAPSAANALPHGGLQRSATSPGLRQRLSIRVTKKDRSATAPVPENTTTPATAVHRPRPILRSKTAPSAAHSPITQTFIKVTGPPNSQSLTPRSHTYSLSENSLPPTPMTTHTANTSVLDSIDILDPTRPQPPPPPPQRSNHIIHQLSQSEPSWDMLTSSAAVTVSPPPPRKELYPRVKSPEDLEKQIVQVSVARQVSVSKARQQVRQAIVSKQPLRPRVVELGREKARKSTVGVLEGGDE